MAILLALVPPRLYFLLLLESLYLGLLVAAAGALLTWEHVTFALQLAR